MFDESLIIYYFFYYLFYPLKVLLTNLIYLLIFRNKSGIWGWRSDKNELVNGHECKVFSATNVEFVTKTRTEHLTESDKMKARSPKTPFQNFLVFAEVEEKQASVQLDNVKIFKPFKTTYI